MRNTSINQLEVLVNQPCGLASCKVEILESVPLLTVFAVIIFQGCHLPFVTVTAVSHGIVLPGRSFSQASNPSWQLEQYFLSYKQNLEFVKFNLEVHFFLSKS